MFSPAIFPSLSAVLADPHLPTILASREWRLVGEELVRAFPPVDLLSWGGLWSYALRDSSMYDMCVLGSSFLLPMLEAGLVYKQTKTRRERGGGTLSLSLSLSLYI